MDGRQTSLQAAQDPHPLEHGTGHLFLLRHDGLSPKHLRVSLSERGGGGGRRRRGEGGVDLSVDYLVCLLQKI